MTYFLEKELQCKCNYPDCKKLVLNPYLMPILNNIRLIYQKPMIVTSGYRCPKHNKDVGGKPGSEHLTGSAVDVKCLNGDDRFSLISACLECGIKRIGIGSGFVHIGISDVLPQKVMWIYND